MPQLLFPQKRPGTHCMGGWVGSRAILDKRGKFAPTGIQSLAHPAHSKSLYQRSYASPHLQHNSPPAQMCVSSRASDREHQITVGHSRIVSMELASYQTSGMGGF